jgi:ribosomal protein S18 acetylase RimI-like enzyme
MAARSSEALPRVAELRHIVPDALGELLAEEVHRWRSRLHWDFTPSANLVRRYAGMQALEGVALMEGRSVAGYCYWVCEERKILLGDFYVRDAWRNPRNEQYLLEEALNAARGGRLARPGPPRIEAQLMQMDLRAAEFGRGTLIGRAWARDFMLAGLDGAAALPPAGPPRGIRIEPWDSRWLEASADLIAESYRGHADAEINDQYRSAAGARRFLQNIVQYPGCGRFAPHCSFAALDGAGRVRGLAAATVVAPGTGHVAQVCVGPEVRSMGLGYELMRRAMRALAGDGCFEASLTVTSANAKAVELYLRLGFRVIHRFDALVWEAPGGPLTTGRGERSAA